MPSGVSVKKENLKLYSSISALYYEIQAYEIFNVAEQFRLKRAIKNVCAEISVEENPWVLDLGSGTGNLSSVLSSEFRGASIVVSDLSIHMLFENKAAHRVVCDAEWLPFRKNVFRLVTTYSLFHHLPSGEALEEICRVSTPHTILYFDHDPFIQQPLPGPHYKFFFYIGHLLWLLVKPERFRKLLRYLAGDRRRHKAVVQELDWALTDGNPVDLASIVKVLKKNGFRIRLLKYAWSSALMATRG